MKREYVYMIGSEHDLCHPVKIGVTRDIEKRLSQINTGNHEQLNVKATIGPLDQKAAYALEDSIHAKLHSYHIRGEWFTSSCKPAFVLAAEYTCG